MVEYRNKSTKVAPTLSLPQLMAKKLSTSVLKRQAMRFTAEESVDSSLPIASIDDDDEIMFELMIPKRALAAYNACRAHQNGPL